MDSENPGDGIHAGIIFRVFGGRYLFFVIANSINTMITPTPDEIAKTIASNMDWSVIKIFLLFGGLFLLFVYEYMCQVVAVILES